MFKGIEIEKGTGEYVCQFQRYMHLTVCTLHVTNICVGSVILSKAGQALMSVVTDKVKIDGFAKFVNNVIVKESGGIFDDMFGE